MFKITSALILFILIFSLTSNAQGNDVIIKGIVHKWPTDTVYVYKLPFHSPYSSSMKYQVISNDYTFNIKFASKDLPSVYLIGPERHPLELKIESLLFDNLTSNHYYGHCIKVYTVGVSTFLIEPNTTLDIELTFDSWIESLSPKRAKSLKKMGIPVTDDNKVRDYGTTKIIFKGQNQFYNKYYQQSFNLDDKLDKALERTKNISSAISKLEKVKTKLLMNLESNRDKLSPVFYDYIKAEIEFGARKEFLKYLRFEREEYLQNLFSKEIPKEILDIVEFDKSVINNAILTNEEYNEYLELYLNFKMNIVNMEYIVYNEFSNKKFTIALKELPQISKYYYLANNLLHVNNTNDFGDLYKNFTKLYPVGELNNKLKEKFEIE